MADTSIVVAEKKGRKDEKGHTWFQLSQAMPRIFLFVLLSLRLRITVDSPIQYSSKHAQETSTLAAASVLVHIKCTANGCKGDCTRRGFEELEVAQGVTRRTVIPRNLEEDSPPRRKRRECLDYGMYRIIKLYAHLTWF